jgi:hypothetical protein
MSAIEPTASPPPPSKSWFQNMNQSVRGGDDKRVFTLDFKNIYYGYYTDPNDTTQTEQYSYDTDRSYKIDTFNKDIASKIKKYVNFHKIGLPTHYRGLEERACMMLSLLSLDKYVISGDVNMTVDLNDNIKNELLEGDYEFWDKWTYKDAKANIADTNDNTKMNGKVSIDFHFDFSKLKSLPNTGGTRRNRRRRIVSRRLKKSHRSFGTRKNRRLYRK